MPGFRALLQGSIAGFIALSAVSVRSWCPDGDGDGVCDTADLCTGDDATGDADGDGLCQDRDLCLGDNQYNDVDGDGVCGDLDLCQGDDASGDTDVDGVCDDRDACVGNDWSGNTDGDGYCDDADQCFGNDDAGDLDADGTCDDIDPCIDLSDPLDSDGDGICDGVDLCEGDDASGDTDADGFCDDVDFCFGDDGLGDLDHDGICDSLDSCLGTNSFGDSDGDGYCDDIDPCDDAIVTVGCDVPDPLPINVCGGVALLHQGRHTGFVECPGGGMNRIYATSGWDLSTYMPVGDQRFNTHPSDECTQDSDCQSHDYGGCGFVGGVGRCVYGCDNDEDCGLSQVCLPPSAGTTGTAGVRRSGWAGSPLSGRGVCIAASCSSSEDCATGECGYSWSHQPGCNTEGLSRMSCRTDQDACESNADCQYPRWPSPITEWVCESSGDEFSCQGSRPSNCGRPMRDAAGGFITAATVMEAGWFDVMPVRVEGLDQELRQTLGAQWLGIAAMEHASVASFARHALELMHLGAPAELLADLAKAQMDEVAHARLAYGIASTYLGEPCGPGPLPAPPPPCLAPEDILRGLLDEGCVGETVAAAEASWRASRAQDPVIATAYARIAAEEATHAELAWRTVAWMLRRWPELAAICVVVPEPVGSRPGADPLASHGELTSEERGWLHRSVLRDVVAPTARSALESTLRQH